MEFFRELLRLGLFMVCLFLRNCWAIGVEQFRKKCFSRGTLATLPLPPSLRNFFFTISTMLTMQNLVSSSNKYFKIKQDHGRVSFHFVATVAAEGPF